MPAVNVEIKCEIDVPVVNGTYDFQKKQVTPEDFNKFVAGELGDYWLEILIPDDGIFAQLQAQKSQMKKKGAIFEVSAVDGVAKLKVQGVFKVSAYAHVIPKIKNNADKLYVSGLFSGDYPSFGGHFKGVDQDKGIFPVLAKLV